MSQMPRFSRRARWAVPSGAVVVAVGVVVAGSVLTGAQAAPALPARTPAQLIAAIAANKSVPASLSGTIVSNAALGLPDLPGAGNPTSPASLLTGSHTINFWYARPGQLRIALPVPLGETDLRVDGPQVWLWDSKTNTATHIKLPTSPRMPMPGSRITLRHVRLQRALALHPSGQAHSWTTSSAMSNAYQSNLTISPPTPRQVALRLLAAVGPTTAVSVQSNVVAGRAAYQLVLAPRNHGSLIGRVAIAVDASRYLPLRVQVFARGSASPAYQVGFTSISFARPAASNFAFTPPPGAKVKTITPPPVPFGPFGPFGALAGVNGGGLVAVPKGMKISRAMAGAVRDGSSYRLRGMPRCGIMNMAPRRAILGIPNGSYGISSAGGATKSMRVSMKVLRQALPRHLSKSQRRRLLRMLRAQTAHVRLVHPRVGWHGAGWYGYAPMSGAPFPPGVVSPPRVIGSDWTAVGVFPAAGLNAGSVGGPAGLLLRSATPVHGSWGSGRLLRTSLLSVLITDNGKVLIGAVTPSVLYAAAAQAK